MQRRRLFITGVTGYVGRRLLERLDRGSFSAVIALVRERQPAVVELAADRDVALVIGDLLEPASYRHALQPGDRVLHLAAATGRAPREEHFRVNLDGTGALLATCSDRDAEGIVHISTIAAKFQEQRGYPYAQSKRRAEGLVAGSRLAYTILRPTMVFGPKSPILAGLSRLASLPVMPVFGHGRVRVQPVFVDDLVDAICAVLAAESIEAEGEMIEIGGPEVIEIGQLLVEIRRRRRGKPGPRVRIPIAPLRTALTLMESMSLDLVPVTAGQLATFVNDGTAADSPFLRARLGTMSGIDEMLAAGQDE